MTDFEIKSPAMAGTLESSDIQILIDKNDGKGIEIDLKSNVEKQYGRQILETIHKTLNTLGVKDATLTVVDQGALDCTIVARTVAVVHRASGIKKEYNWEEIESWDV